MNNSLFIQQLNRIAAIRKLIPAKPLRPGLRGAVSLRTFPAAPVILALATRQDANIE
jgi:hypothetical protein